MLDQLFSKIAEYLKYHPAYDRQGILDAIDYGFRCIENDQPKPVMKNLDRSANISEWIEPYLAPTPNVTLFRQFKFEKIGDRVMLSVRSRCKEDAKNNPWQSLSVSGSPHSEVSHENEKHDISLDNTGLFGHLMLV